VEEKGESSAKENEWSGRGVVTLQKSDDFPKEKLGGGKKSNSFKCGNSRKCKRGAGLNFREEEKIRFAKENIGGGGKVNLISGGDAQGKRNMSREIDRRSFKGYSCCAGCDHYLLGRGGWKTQKKKHLDWALGQQKGGERGGRWVAWVFGKIKEGYIHKVSRHGRKD